MSQLLTETCSVRGPKLHRLLRTVSFASSRVLQTLWQRKFGFQTKFGLKTKLKKRDAEITAGRNYGPSPGTAPPGGLSAGSPSQYAACSSIWPTGKEP